ncbi:MAG TPA: aldo/keto reductase [Caulobacteraceae bacterium]|jgi:aryl-alcohol dehydrogenase-like predicted oxidoreductase
MQTTPLRRLGKSGAEVPAIGVGTNRWSYGANDAPVFETYQALVEAGGGFIDTAEIYGFGKSERLIGECVRKDGRPVFVASKFAPFLVRTSPGSLMAALDATLTRLGLACVDLYYVHFPFPFVDLADFADGLAEAVKSGKARHVGVSNFNADQMRRVADRLARSNIPLAANEVQYSLAHRNPESNGVLEACRELDVALVAYFPLASGRLTGPPTDDAKPDKLDGLRRALAGVAQSHQALQSQVALNWLLARDPCVIPIPGATKARHAQANLGALEWRLTDEEFALLDAASAPAK